jgi:deoxycytidylate deaminase
LGLIVAHQNITAIIFDKKGRVLSIGKNSYIKTHPRQARYAKAAGLPEKQFLHAEIAAIIKCRSLEKAHRILVTRINKKGKPALAKPCPVCEVAIREAGIKEVDWTI